ncbi:MAG TPA: hypothetical protein VGG68_03000 [Caulobacteraceae bacterium]|jgi:hypothetical protein
MTADEFHRVKTMKSVHSLAILMLAMTAPSVSIAQAAPYQPPPPQAAPDQAAPAPAPAADTAGVNASTGPIPADQLPPAQASALAAGDNQIVTNGPVPDTAANRAKYGGPNSHAGRRTAPAGN